MIVLFTQIIIIISYFAYGQPFVAQFTNGDKLIVSEYEILFLSE